jgi:hypothetical protein
MIKATAETLWIDLDAQQQHPASNVSVLKRIRKAKRVLQYLDPRRFITLSKAVSNKVTSNNSKNKIWTAYISLQQQKAGNMESDRKDEFFYGIGYTNRKKIPHKTWKRHSAFLHYMQEQKVQKPKSVREEDRPTAAATMTSVSEANRTQARISFKVTSIKRLPIWATALNEMALIENDISPFRLMKSGTTGGLTIKAA